MHKLPEQFQVQPNRTVNLISSGVLILLTHRHVFKVKSPPQHWHPFFIVCLLSQTQRHPSCVQWSENLKTPSMPAFYWQNRHPQNKMSSRLHTPPVRTVQASRKLVPNIKKASTHIQKISDRPHNKFHLHAICLLPHFLLTKNARHLYPTRTRKLLSSITNMRESLWPWRISSSLGRHMLSFLQFLNPHYNVEIPQHQAWKPSRPFVQHYIFEENGFVRYIVSAEVWNNLLSVRPLAAQWPEQFVHWIYTPA